MTLQQLEYVIALDNHRNFVLAAEHCYVTQPTLTMQLKKLEEEINMQLFDRTKKPVQPTKAGEQFITKARQILREVNQLKAFVHHEKETLTGEYRIGIIPTLAPYLLPLFLKAFTDANPGVKLMISEMQSEAIIKGLKNDTLDIGLLATPLGERALREIPLFYEPFLFYHPKDYELSKAEVTPNDVDPEEMLVLSEGHCFRNQMLNICNKTKQEGQFGFEYESGSIEALKKMVRQGMGTTLVPKLAVDVATDRGYATHFKSPEPTREVSIVVHNSFTKELLIDKLRDAINENIPASFKKGKKHIRVEWR